MAPKPLDYAQPDKRRPYSRAAIFSLAFSAMSGPLGALSDRFPIQSQEVFWTSRFLPLGMAVLLGLWTYLSLESKRQQFRGLWLVGLGLFIDVIWSLALLSVPI